MSIAKQVNTLLKSSGKLAKTPRTTTIETRMAAGEYLLILAPAGTAQTNGFTDQDGSAVTLSGSDNGPSNEPKVAGVVRARNLNWYLGEVSHLTVAPEFRGRGVARKLFDIAEAKLKAKGAKVIVATDASDDPAAVAERYDFPFSYDENTSFTNAATGHEVNVLLKTV